MGKNAAAPATAAANPRAGNASVDAKLQLALAYHQAGRLSPAEDLYLQVLQVAPHQADALHLLGCLHSQQGKLSSAVDLICKAINAEPSTENYHFSLGNTLLAQGRLEAAAASYRQAILLKPDYAEAYSNLGNVLTSLCRLDESVASCRQAILLKPDYAEACSNLGNALQAQGKLVEAVSSFRQAILLKPDFSEAHSNLGNALLAQGKPDEAVASCRQALSIRPDLVVAYINLGNALQAQCHLDEAVASFRQALLLTPDSAEAFNNLGSALLAQGLRDEAIACCQQALSIKPDYAEAFSNLGNALLAKCRLDEAVACYRQALLLKPDFAKAFCNLGNALKDQGKPDEAVASFRQALLLTPDYADAHSNLIFTLDMKSGTNTAVLQAERRCWSEAFASGLPGSPAFANRPEPERRLRIGYVSGDFREHSASVVFGAMLTKFDPTAFDVFAYSNSVTENGHTQLFQNSVTGWRKIAGLSDAAVADLIRQDSIDILVDLSGFTAGNRLQVFARKPAPIQITAWGYIGGTGMQAMDVFLADPVVVPPEEKSLYAEEIRYLPNVVSAFFPNPFPAVNDLPAREGIVTFGSFNRLCKVTAETCQTWTQVLRAIPSSRMLLKTPELDDPGTRARVLGDFTQAGIDPARITFQGKTPWHEHMAAFNQIDMAIDPFPHGGGVTALEGLMMGVPAITLRCPTIPGRLSASILTTLALTDWIAETPEQYVDIAVQKAKDLGALAELRQQLRPRFMASIIGDTTAYARVVEQEYRKLWQEWCRKM